MGFVQKFHRIFSLSKNKEHDTNPVPVWPHDKHIINGPSDLWFGITCCRAHDGHLRPSCERLILGHDSDFGWFCKEEETYTEMPVYPVRSFSGRGFVDFSPTHLLKKLFFISFCTSKSSFIKNNDRVAAPIKQACFPSLARTADPALCLPVALVAWD